MAQGLLRVRTTWHLEGSLRERVGEGVGVGDGEENPGWSATNLSDRRRVSMGEEGSVWGRVAEGAEVGMTEMQDGAKPTAGMEPLNLGGCDLVIWLLPFFPATHLVIWPFASYTSAIQSCRVHKFDLFLPGKCSSYILVLESSCLFLGVEEPFVLIQLKGLQLQKPFAR